MGLRDNSKHKPMFFEEYTAERFGQHIRKHVLGGHVKQRDLSFMDAFPNEMVPSVDVLGSGMMRGVLGECLGSLVVNVNGNGGIRAEIEFCEEMAEPQPFLAGIQQCLVLGLGA